MNDFAEKSIKFINSVVNSDDLLNEFNSVLTQSVQFLKEGKHQIPMITNEYYNLIKSYDFFRVPFIEHLSKTILDEGVPKKHGYNAVTIQSIIPETDVSVLLERLPTEISGLYNTLDKIYEYTQGDPIFYKALQIMLFDPSQWSPVLLSKLRDNGSFINHIFNQSMFQDSEISTTVYAFPYIYTYVILETLYFRYSNVFNKYSYKVLASGTVTNDSLISEMSSYFDSDPLSNQLSDFIVINIFHYIGTSTDFQSTLKGTIQEQLLEFKNVFMGEFQKRFSQRNIYSIVNDIIQNVISHTSLTYLNKSNGDNNDVPFYDMLKDLAFTDDLGLIGMKEDAFRSTIKDYLNDNINALQSLEKVCFQFKSDPRYFINSHIIVHLAYANILLEAMSSIDVRFMFMNNFYYEQKCESVIFNYLQNHPLLFSENIILLSSSLAIGSIIHSIMSSETIRYWIIDVFLKNVFDSSSSMFKHNLDIYQEVDKVIEYLKISLLEHLFTNNMIANTNSELYSLLQESISEANMIIDEDNIMQVIGLVSTSTLNSIMDSFYKHSVISTYVENILGSYSY